MAKETGVCVPDGPVTFVPAVKSHANFELSALVQKMNHRALSLGMSSLRMEGNVEPDSILLESCTETEHGEGSKIYLNLSSPSRLTSCASNGIIWRKNDQGKWNIRKLRATKQFLYILSCNKYGQEYIVDKILMRNICEVMSTYEDASSTDQTPALGESEVHKHTFCFKVVESVQPKLIRTRKARTYAPKPHSTSNTSLPNETAQHKQYQFHTGDGDEAGRCCEEWVAFLNKTAAEAASAFRQKEVLRNLQDVLHGAYEASPFQVFVIVAITANFFVSIAQVQIVPSAQCGAAVDVPDPAVLSPPTEMEVRSAHPARSSPLPRAEVISSRSWKHKT